MRKNGKSEVGKKKEVGRGRQREREGEREGRREKERTERGRGGTGERRAGDKKGCEKRKRQG